MTLSEDQDEDTFYSFIRALLIEYEKTTSSYEVRMSRRGVRRRGEESRGERDVYRRMIDTKRT